MRYGRHISSGAAAAVLLQRYRPILVTLLGCLIVFDSAVGSATNPPVITSSLFASGISGFYFDYQIEATNDPVAFGATGLPSWLTIDTTTGEISGIPPYPPPGTFTVGLSATNSAGTGTADLQIKVLPTDATPTPTPTPSPPRALNFSTRVDVETGDDVAIGGFIVTSDIFPGTVVKTVVIRALGPSLGSSGVGGTIANPVLELNEPDGSVITNNNWKDNSEIDRGIIAQTGLNMYNGNVISDLESVLVAALPSVDPMVAGSGQYTAVVSGLNGDTGVGLVEVYDIDPEAPFETPAELANISTRGIVGTADSALIGGVIIGSSVNETTPTASVVVRAIGPSLANANPPITDPLADPFLQLVSSDGMTIATNDNWMNGADAATIQSLGLAPTNDSESALLANLAPGNYTAIVMGNNAGVGVASVEIFRVPTQTTVHSR